MMRKTVAVSSLAVLLTGCQFGGLNSLNMPGTAGHGSGSYVITVQLPDVSTLPQNSPVMVDDVTVGSVSGIDAVQRSDGSFFASVELSLDGDVNLPVNATARVAQTSLLGSQHVELAEPIDEPRVGRLEDGSQIPLERTGRYPTTEEVLASLGVVVNKGNLGALQDITEETYNAVAGREGQFTDLIPRLAELTSSLDRQTNDIIAAAEGLNRFAGILAQSKDSLGRTLDTLPEALEVLNRNRTTLVEAFAALRSFATVGSRVLDQTKDDFAADFKDLFPIIKSLNDNADAFIKSLEFLPTFPFHYKYLRNAVRGDYLNVFVTFDLTLRRLGETVFTTSKGLDPNMKRMNEIITRPTSSPEPSRTSRVRPPTRSRWHRERRPSTRRRRDRPAHEDPADDLRRRDSADGRLDPIFYLRLPEAVGLGSYKVTANFVAGGGLYENANVTFRGVTVGRVETVGLTDDGVVAHMRLQSGTPVPENVTVTVKSVSAVGEQYIDLVPPEQPAQATLRNGAEIGVDRTAIGQDIYGLLQQADALVSSVGDSRVQDLLRETFKAFNGSGPELAQLIQSSRLLIDEANANYGQTTQLIDQAGPFLDAQIRGGDDIKSLADGLARFTGEVANADPQLRSVLQTVPGATETVNTTFEGIRPTFPVLAANLANFGRIGVIYNKSLEHSLVVFPALLAALNTVAGGVPADEGGKLDFKIDLGGPPPCSVGFIPPPQIRSPADTTLRELPTDMYCKVPHNDPSVVRGARNYPCQEFPGKRAPTIQLCRDPNGYVPIGSNPWRGPPIPVGTPMDTREDNHYEPPGRNILPPNKFPYIPPHVDPDPGPPVVQLPPGGRCLGRVRRRMHPSRCRCRPTRSDRRRRRGPTSRPRTTSFRRTAARPRRLNRRPRRHRHLCFPRKPRRWRRVPSPRGWGMGR